MENEDNLRDGVFKSRLTDITNRPPRRPISSISGDDGNSQFTKKVCLGVENLVKKKCQSQLVSAQTHPNNKGKTLLKPKGKDPLFKLPFCSDAFTQNVSSQNMNLPSDVSEEQNLLGGGGNSVGFGEKGQGRPSTEGFINRAIESDDMALTIWHQASDVTDNLASSKCATMELPTNSASGGSKFPGLERCAQLKGDGAANSTVAGGDLLKNCSCSFCSKAAYMWSDLHYQDVKGRLSAVKYSQKEASMIFQKFSGLEDTVIDDQQSSTESFKLELSLMHQWKSLFAHMENAFVQESSQLESSLETLKDLRKNCKDDLELSGNSQFDNH
ncbi:uncharacterized protein LOC133290019 [Gastrolobium bilobum]|uniref:uncharacterized protein LOC133290019 n=1 Tax=Gastrolobium bilobum TaxID=150636 RepID=UPI002AAF5D78|nr:uncharacterized protein LOC133290019 [Gastrolobium bilobum]